VKAIVQAEPKAAAERTEYQEFVVPVVNIFETKDGYALEAEMPGVKKDGLEITLEGNEITILGRRAAEPVNGELLLRERSAADYRRVFELDPAIDTSKISAKMEQGMLTLTLPKSEQVKPRKITVSDQPADFSEQLPRPNRPWVFILAWRPAGGFEPSSRRRVKKAGGCGDHTRFNIAHTRHAPSSHRAGQT
jgi:HSP20 family protein